MEDLVKAVWVLATMLTLAIVIGGFAADSIITQLTRIASALERSVTPPQREPREQKESAQ